MFENTKADLRATKTNSVKALLTNRGLQALITYRLSRWMWRHHIPLIPMVLTRIIQILYSIDIDWRAEIQGGCVIFHGVGLVIGPWVTIGTGAILYHGVTLGRLDPRTSERDGLPCVGDRVLIGCGAKVLGPITVGSDVTIGANAVVLSDVPDGVTAVGVPAKYFKGER